MKRFLLILVCLLFLLVACDKNYTSLDYGDTDKVPPSHTSGEEVFFANQDTLKYHLSSCRYSQEGDLIIVYDEDFLIERGYTPCKICLYKQESTL